MRCAIRYEIRNTFIIAMYGIINYLLLMPNLVVFLQNLMKDKFCFVFEVSFSIYQTPPLAVDKYRFSSCLRLMRHSDVNIIVDGGSGISSINFQ